MDPEEQLFNLLFVQRVLETEDPLEPLIDNPETYFLNWPDSPDDHPIRRIIGETGIGKSWLIRRIRTGLQAAGWTIWWIDLEGVGDIDDHLCNTLNGWIERYPPAHSIALSHTRDDFNTNWPAFRQWHGNRARSLPVVLVVDGLDTCPEEVQERVERGLILPFVEDEKTFFKVIAAYRNEQNHLEGTLDWYSTRLRVKSLDTPMEASRQIRTIYDVIIDENNILPRRSRAGPDAEYLENLQIIFPPSYNAMPRFPFDQNQVAALTADELNQVHDNQANQQYTYSNTYVNARMVAQALIGGNLNRISFDSVMEQYLSRGGNGVLAVSAMIEAIAIHFKSNPFEIADLRARGFASMGVDIFEGLRSLQKAGLLSVVEDKKYCLDATLASLIEHRNAAPSI